MKKHALILAGLVSISLPLAYGGQDQSQNADQNSTAHPAEQSSETLKDFPKRSNNDVEHKDLLRYGSEKQKERIIEHEQGSFGTPGQAGTSQGTASSAETDQSANDKNSSSSIDGTKSQSDASQPDSKTQISISGQSPQADDQQKTSQTSSTESQLGSKDASGTAGSFQTDKKSDKSDGFHGHLKDQEQTQDLDKDKDKDQDRSQTSSTGSKSGTDAVGAAGKSGTETGASTEANNSDVASAVKSKLKEWSTGTEGALSASDLKRIHVMQQGDQIVLRGTVSSDRQKQIVEDQVRQVKGVHQIQNDLQVNNADKSSSNLENAGSTAAKPEQQ